MLSPLLYLSLFRFCGERELRPRCIARPAPATSPEPATKLEEYRQPPRLAGASSLKTHRPQLISTQASRLLTIVSSNPHVKSLVLNLSESRASMSAPVPALTPQ